MTKKLSWKICLIYFALFLTFMTLGLAEINGLSPFVFALFFACIFVGLDEKLCAVFTMTSALVYNISLQNFFVALTVVASGLIMYYIHKLIKRNIKIWTLFLCFVVAFATYTYYNLANVKLLVYYFVLAVICLLVFVVIMQVLCLKKNPFKLTLDESVCFLFGIAFLGLGVAKIKLMDFEIFRFILALIIFLLLSIGKSNLTYSIVTAFAFGVGVGNFSLSVVAEFLVITLIAGAFNMPNRWKIVLSGTIADIFIQHFFFMAGWQMLDSVLPIILAGVLFAILPSRLLNRISDYVYVKNSEISSRNLINLTRKNLRKRMSELSNVFLDMKEIHLNMVKKQLTKDELVAMLIREVGNSCCRDCLERNRCTRALGTDNKSNLETLIEIAITKGKVTLLDIPPSLTNRCVKVNTLVTLINRLTSEYKQYKSMLSDVNNVKILLADQMGAVSRLLLSIGQEIDTNVTFDIARENKIISKLLSQNIECKEVLIYTDKNEDVSCELVIKGGIQHKASVEKILTETLKMPMVLKKVTPIDNSAFCSLTLTKQGKYDCVFGLASCTKSGNVESGDCHSIIRLSGDRFLLALCDGMGSGKSANQMSAMTLGLIENFYKAGFDNDVILQSVNKLLAINNEESYSTLDVCLIDLNRQIADFIKVGAPFGVIKRSGETKVIEGGALPIGALDNITPFTYKTTISTKDIVIMATDGIMDAFISQENFVEFVGKLATNNPQVIAEAILNEALRIYEMSAKDDMTVLVARTYLKN